MNQDGISSWMLAVKSPKYPYGNIGESKNRPITKFLFNTIIHLVRNPFDAIPSIILENKYSSKSYNFRRNMIRKYLQINLPIYNKNLSLKEDISIAIQTIIYWNRLCELCKPTFIIRLEDSFNLLQEYNKNNILEKNTLNIYKNPTKTKRFPDGKYHTKPIITINNYNNINQELKVKLKEYCNTYGYTYIL